MGVVSSEFRKSKRQLSAKAEVEGFEKQTFNVAAQGHATVDYGVCILSISSDLANILNNASDICEPCKKE